MELKSRQGRLVFVDPDDEDIPYWWPAIVVPEEEYELFKETMDNDAGMNVEEHERLVCYFEDGSFSVVPKSSLIPFNPQKEPYKSYSSRLKNFLTDAGVKRATEFHNSGEIPKMFKWLILGETGYLDPESSNPEIEGSEVNLDFIEDDYEESKKNELNNNIPVIEEAGDDEDDDDDDEIVEIEKRDKSEYKKKKRKKSNSIIKEAKNSIQIPSKRGRKPKKNQEIITENNSLSNDPNSRSNSDYSSEIISPKTVNLLEIMKIEALISDSIIL